MYDFEPFIEVVNALGMSLVPLAIPAIATWLLLHWLAEIIFKS